MSNILEVYGPTAPYIEIQGENNNVVKLVYRTICYRGKSEVAVKLYMEKVLAYIRGQLVGKQFLPIIFWRTTPEYSRDGKVWYGYARLVTSPPLSLAFWDVYGKEEGKAVREIPG